MLNQSNWLQSHCFCTVQLGHNINLWDIYCKHLRISLAQLYRSLSGGLGWGSHTVTSLLQSEIWLLIHNLLKLSIFFIYYSYPFKLIRYILCLPYISLSSFEQTRKLVALLCTTVTSVEHDQLTVEVQDFQKRQL